MAALLDDLIGFLCDLDLDLLISGGVCRLVCGAHLPILCAMKKKENKTHAGAGRGRAC